MSSVQLSKETTFTRNKRKLVTGLKGIVCKKQKRDDATGGDSNVHENPASTPGNDGDDGSGQLDTAQRVDTTPANANHSADHSYAAAALTGNVSMPVQVMHANNDHSHVSEPQPSAANALNPGADTNVSTDTNVPTDKPSKSPNLNQVSVIDQIMGAILSASKSNNTGAYESVVSALKLDGNAVFQELVSARLIDHSNIDMFANAIKDQTFWANLLPRAIMTLDVNILQKIRNNTKIFDMLQGIIRYGTSNFDNIYTNLGLGLDYALQNKIPHSIVVDVINELGNEAWGLSNIESFDAIHEGNILLKLMTHYETDVFMPFIENFKVVFPLYKHAHTIMVHLAKTNNDRLANVLLKLYWPVPDKALIRVINDAGATKFSKLFVAHLPHNMINKTNPVERNDATADFENKSFLFTEHVGTKKHDEGRRVSIELYKGEYLRNSKEAWAKYILTGEMLKPCPDEEVTLGKRNKYYAYEAFIKAVLYGNVEALQLIHLFNMGDIEIFWNCAQGPFMDALLSVVTEDRGLGVVKFLDRKWLLPKNTYVEVFLPVLKRLITSDIEITNDMMSIIWRRLGWNPICELMLERASSRGTIGHLNKLIRALKVAHNTFYLDVAKCITEAVCAENSKDLNNLKNKAHAIINSGFFDHDISIGDVNFSTFLADFKQRILESHKVDAINVSATHVQPALTSQPTKNTLSLVSDRPPTIATTDTSSLSDSDQLPVDGANPPNTMEARHEGNSQDSDTTDNESDGQTSSTSSLMGDENPATENIAMDDDTGSDHSESTTSHPESINPDPFDEIHEGDGLLELIDQGDVNSVREFFNDNHIIFPLYKHARDCIASAIRFEKATMLNFLLNMYWPVPNKTLKQIYAMVPRGKDIHQNFILARVPHIISGDVVTFKDTEIQMRNSFFKFTENEDTNSYDKGRRDCIRAYKNQAKDHPSEAWRDYVLVGEFLEPEKSTDNNNVMGQRNNYAVYEAFIKAANDEKANSLDALGLCHYDEITTCLQDLQSHVSKAILSKVSEGRTFIITYLDGKWLHVNEGTILSALFAEMFKVLVKKNMDALNDKKRNIMKTIWNRVDIKDMCKIFEDAAQQQKDQQQPDTVLLTNMARQIKLVDINDKYLQFASRVADWLIKSSHGVAVAYINGGMFNPQTNMDSMSNQLAQLELKICIRLDIKSTDARWATTDTLRYLSTKYFNMNKHLYEYPRDLQHIWRIISIDTSSGGESANLVNAAKDNLRAKILKKENEDIFESIYDDDVLLRLTKSCKSHELVIELVDMFHIVLPLYKHAREIIVEAARCDNKELFDKLLDMYWPVPDMAIINIIKDIHTSTEQGRQINEDIYVRKLLARLPHIKFDQRSTQPRIFEARPESNEYIDVSNKKFVFTVLNEAYYEKHRKDEIQRYKSSFSRDRDTAWHAYVNHGEVLGHDEKSKFPTRGNNSKLETIIKAIRANNVIALDPIKLFIQDVFERQISNSKSIIYRAIVRSAQQDNGPHICQDMANLYNQNSNFRYMWLQIFKESIVNQTYMNLYPIIRGDLYYNDICSYIDDAIAGGNVSFVKFICSSLMNIEISNPNHYLVHANKIMEAITRLGDKLSPLMRDVAIKTLSCDKFVNIKDKLIDMKNRLEQMQTTESEVLTIIANNKKEAAVSILGAYMDKNINHGSVQHHKAVQTYIVARRQKVPILSAAQSRPSLDSDNAEPLQNTTETQTIIRDYIFGNLSGLQPDAVKIFNAIILLDRARVAIDRGSKAALENIPVMTPETVENLTGAAVFIASNPEQYTNNSAGVKHKNSSQFIEGIQYRIDCTPEDIESFFAAHPDLIQHSEHYQYTTEQLVKYSILKPLIRKVITESNTFQDSYLETMKALGKELSLHINTEEKVTVLHSSTSPLLEIVAEKSVDVVEAFLDNFWIVFRFCENAHEALMSAAVTNKANEGTFSMLLDRYAPVHDNAILRLLADLSVKENGLSKDIREQLEARLRVRVSQQDYQSAIMNVDGGQSENEPHTAFNSSSEGHNTGRMHELKKYAQEISSVSENEDDVFGKFCKVDAHNIRAIANVASDGTANIPTTNRELRHLSRNLEAFLYAAKHCNTDALGYLKRQHYFCWVVQAMLAISVKEQNIVHQAFLAAASRCAHDKFSAFINHCKMTGPRYRGIYTKAAEDAVRKGAHKQEVPEFIINQLSEINDVISVIATAFEAGNWKGVLFLCNKFSILTGHAELVFGRMDDDIGQYVGTVLVSPQVFQHPERKDIFKRIFGAYQRKYTEKSARVIVLLIRKAIDVINDNSPFHEIINMVRTMAKDDMQPLGATLFATVNKNMSVFMDHAITVNNKYIINLLSEHRGFDGIYKNKRAIDVRMARALVDNSDTEEYTLLNQEYPNENSDSLGFFIIAHIFCWYERAKGIISKKYPNMNVGAMCNDICLCFLELVVTGPGLDFAHAGYQTFLKAYNLTLDSFDYSYILKKMASREDGIELFEALEKFFNDDAILRQKINEIKTISEAQEGKLLTYLIEHKYAIPKKSNTCVVQ